MGHVSHKFYIFFMTTRTITLRGDLLKQFTMYTNDEVSILTLKLN